MNKGQQPMYTSILHILFKRHTNEHQCTPVFTKYIFLFTKPVEITTTTKCKIIKQHYFPDFLDNEPTAEMTVAFVPVAVAVKLTTPGPCTPGALITLTDTPLG